MIVLVLWIRSRRLVWKGAGTLAGYRRRYNRRSGICMCVKHSQHDLGWGVGFRVLVYFLLSDVLGVSGLGNGSRPL